MKSTTAAPRRPRRTSKPVPVAFSMIKRNTPFWYAGKRYMKYAAKRAISESGDLLTLPDNTLVLKE